MVRGLLGIGEGVLALRLELGEEHFVLIGEVGVKTSEVEYMLLGFFFLILLYNKLGRRVVDVQGIGSLLDS
jgi:hypothetical protein